MENTKADILPVSEEYLFSDETMEGLRELGAVLQGIHNRLLAEGYVLKNGKLVKEDDGKRKTNN